MAQGHKQQGYTGRKITNLRKMFAASLPLPCSHCGHTIHPGEKFDIDHLIPVSQGGDALALTNMAVAHVSCNRRAGQAIAQRNQTNKRNQDKRFRQW